MLILVRGVPGSGKSTYAKTLVNYAIEADHYFVRIDGVYDFNPKLLKNAHDWCYNEVVEALRSDPEETVSVANTFTRVCEMQRDIDYAKANNIPFKVVRCQGSFQNIHGVPDKKVQEMLERFEDYEGEELAKSSAIKDFTSHYSEAT